MIVITGAAGFIGSCMISKLNNKGHKENVLVDDFSKTAKHPNIIHKSYREKVERSLFFQWLVKNAPDVEFILHIGARTDTTEFDMAVFDELNLNYSKEIWKYCCQFGIPLIYASSAATYGDGLLGYDDQDETISFKLQPLNPYGISKNEFDKWALLQTTTPPRWYGLKFFNVFGPNEYHKGRMASVVYHAFNQVMQGEGGQLEKGTGGPVSKETGRQGNGVVKLFRSHNPHYPDGGQLRDFIYVKDVMDVIYFLMNHPVDSGIFTLGTGKARTFLDLAGAVYAALDRPATIEFIDTPIDIRDKYQYFTEARMEKLRKAGYAKPFFTLEDAVEEYVQGYLVDGIHF